MATLGERDAAYVRKVIGAQRAPGGGRARRAAGVAVPAGLAGRNGALSVAKVLENMEIGHNIMHGQWDWMRDPEIHSTTWEWDNVSAAEGWKKSHNFEHHTFTNVVGKDRDLGYSCCASTPSSRGSPIYLAQPFYNVLLALVRVGRRAASIWRSTRLARAASRGGPSARTRAAAPQGAQAGRQGLRRLAAAVGPVRAAGAPGQRDRERRAQRVDAHRDLLRALPRRRRDVRLDEADLDDETRGGWYVRQLLGSCNVDGSPLLHLMTGNLSYQIEHHLFPDLPSQPLPEVAPRVREVCERYGLPYISGALPRQYAQVLRKIIRMSLPGGGAPAPAPAVVGEPAAPEPLALAACRPATRAGRVPAAPRRCPGARPARRAPAQTPRAAP